MQFFLRGIFDAGKDPGEPTRYNEGFLRDVAIQETDLNKLGEEIDRRVSEIEERDKMLADSDLPSRLQLLKQSLSFVVFDFLRSGLFEKDKLTVATLVAMRVMIDEGLLDKIYLDVMMRARSSEDVTVRGPELSRWLSEISWCRLKAVEEDLSSINPIFADLSSKVNSDCDDWEEWYNFSDPEVHPMPGDFKEVFKIFCYCIYIIFSLC